MTMYKSVGILVERLERCSLILQSDATKLVTGRIVGKFITPGTEVLVEGRRSIQHARHAGYT